ncbi:histone deacetylase [Cytophagaceae bacterium ABcell3]|nr:histone deacetylase [Cytophagaceae bacterium ABcell3]
MLKIAWAENYVHPLPEGHRFPMEKYALIHDQLVYEGTVSDDNFFTPIPAKEHYITEVHQPSYWEKLKNLNLTKQEERRTGFPLSAGLVEREVTIVGGTVQTAIYAIKYGVSLNIAGGTHHAYSDRGEGFCLLNDIAVAAGYLLKKGLAHRILICDLDVHQGNGTAEIFAGSDNVFTFSMHGEGNYPHKKESSDLDVGLPDKTTDEGYLHVLTDHLTEILENFKPDFIFYQSGVDVLSTDKLGRLSLTKDGCKDRDAFVLETCYKYGLPVSITMGGGYSPRIADITEAHCNTFRLAKQIFF